MLALWVFFVIRGHRKGFLRAAVGTFSFVIVIFLSTALASPVSQILEKTALKTTIESAVSDAVESKLETDADGLSQDEQDSLLESLPLPSSIQDSLKESNTIENYVQMGVDSFSEYVAESVSDVILNAAAYVIVMIIAIIVIRIILAAAKFVNKIPVIGGINRFLGALLGFFEGLLVLWAAGLAIIALAGTGFGMKAVEVIQSNAFLDLIFDNNPLTAMFGLSL